MKGLISPRSRRLHHRIDVVKSLPLEPSEFCRKWITHIAPDERGYLSECRRELAKATGLSVRTIESWGADFSKRPDYVLTILRKEDIIRQVQQLTMPEDFPEA